MAETVHQAYAIGFLEGCADGRSLILTKRGNFERAEHGAVDNRFLLWPTREGALRGREMWCPSTVGAQVIRVTVREFGRA